MASRIALSLWAILWLFITSAQGPNLEGTWYGVISPPGAQFEIAVNLQRKSGSWTGMLLLENGRTVPASNIVVEGNAISFSLDQSSEKTTLKGEVSGNASEISGTFTQGDSSFPVKLSRNATATLRGASIAIDPAELIAMMTPFSGPMSDRPFVPPITHPDIGYGVRPSRDPVANLIRDVQEGRVEVKFERDDGYLKSLLNALRIPIESQLSVFSKNSLQSAIITPENPRVLYFNDSVAVGYVRGGFIELAAQDPEQGVNFYMLPQQPAGKPPIIRRDNCLQCHLSRNSMDVPGMLMRSVYPSAGGAPINPLGSHLLDHRTKFEERWGGWYVTGDAGSMQHLGNSVVSDATKPESRTLLKDEVQSDIVALMVFEHQMHMMNLITRAGWEFRMAASLKEATGKPNEAIERQLHDAVQELVDYLLFIDEPPLPDKIRGESGFAEKFASLGPTDSKGRSLRQFDLEHRLLRYPCSYMIYSPAFEGLPADAKRSIYQRIREVMSSRFSAADREAVTQILQETKKDF